MAAPYFITGIGTGVGKTVVAAIVCKALQADYWKPIQTGSPSDSAIARSLLGSTNPIHPPVYSFSPPIAPHEAAQQAQQTIQLSALTPPQTANPLVIEGVGGIMVPLNGTDLLIDWVATLSARVICVVDLYLGAINHTLLTLAALRARQIAVLGLVFNQTAAYDPVVSETGKATILQLSHQPALFDVPPLEELSPATLTSFVKSQHLATKL